MSLPQLETILLKAKAGQSGGVTAEECMYLARQMPRREVPSYCNIVLKNAEKTGFLSRRTSRVGQAWDLSEGHGSRRMYYENVQGGAVDNTRGPAYTVDDAYMANKTPEQREKIHKLRTRMSARGAINIPGMNPSEVEIERRKEMERRRSRRAEVAH